MKIIQFFKKSLLLCGVIAAVMTTAPSCAYARSVDDYGALDLASEYKETLDKMNAVSTPGTSGNSVTETDFAGEGRVQAMFSNLINNKWMITRSMMFGVENIQEAAEALTDVAAARDLLAESRVAMMNDPYASVYYDSQTIEAAKKAAEERIKSETISKFTSSVFSIPYIQAGSNTLYSRMRIIGYICLMAFTVIRVAGISVKYLISTDGKPLDTREYTGVAVYFIILALFITYTPLYARYIMLFSDSLRDALLGIDSQSRTGMDTLIQNFSVMTFLKGEFVGMQHRTTPMHFLAFVGNWARGCVAWLSYLFVSAVIFVIVTAADVTLAISLMLSPIILSVSMLPYSSTWRVNYFHSLFKLSLYIPFAGLFSVIMCFIQTVLPNLSFMQYVCLSYAFFFSASKIPNMAENISGMVFAGDASKIGGFISKAPSRVGKSASFLVSRSSK